MPVVEASRVKPKAVLQLIAEPTVILLLASTPVPRVEALINTCSHAILFSIVDEAKNAVQISQELQLSLSAVYKTLANLEKLTLATIENFEFSNEGKKIKRYRSRIKKANIEIGVNDYEVSLYSVNKN